MKKKVYATLMITLLIVSSFSSIAEANYANYDIFQEILDEYSSFLDETGLVSAAIGKSKANAFYAYTHAYNVFMEEYKHSKIKSIKLQSALKFLVGNEEYGDSEWNKSEIEKYLKKRGSTSSAKNGLKILLETQYKDSGGFSIEGAGAFELIKKTDTIGSEYAYIKQDGNYFLAFMTVDELKLICEKWGNINYKILYASICALEQYDIGD